jgi:molybdopterin/thiamine biosynthesis adenylyltransferase
VKFKHVFLIGVGGTGSHLVGPLVQLLHFHPDGTNDITIIDGDVYEDENATRQVFSAEALGENKARATASRLNVKSIRTIAQYVNKEKFSKILEKTVENSDDPFLVITAVDNHATRHAIISAIDESSYTNFVLISPGNQYSSGQVVLYVKEDGETLTTHPFDKYNDVAEPEDVIPGEGEGCAAQVASSPQLITANMGAAWAVMLLVSNMLDEKGWYEEVHYNCRKAKMVPQGTLKGVLI